MTPDLRKFALTVHLTVSVGWIGAVVVYLALGVAAVASREAQMVRAAWITMAWTSWYVIVPLALTSLLTGLIMSLRTPMRFRASRAGLPGLWPGHDYPPPAY